MLLMIANPCLERGSISSDVILINIGSEAFCLCFKFRYSTLGVKVHPFARL